MDWTHLPIVQHAYADINSNSLFTPHYAEPGINHKYLVFYTTHTQVIRYQVRNEHTTYFFANNMDFP